MANSRGERGHPCLIPKDGCTEAVLSPSNNVHSSAWYSLLRWPGYGQASGKCVNGPKAWFLKYNCKLVWSQKTQHTTVMTCFAFSLQHALHVVEWIGVISCFCLDKKTYGVSEIMLCWMYQSWIMERSRLALGQLDCIVYNVPLRNHSVVPWLCHWPLCVDGSGFAPLSRPGDVSFCDEHFEESSIVRN